MDRGDRIRIMVVDKSATSREGFREFLEGMEEARLVGLAANGVDAVLQASKAIPDVILFNITAFGIHVATTLRTLYRVCPNTPIIALAEDAENHWEIQLLNSESSRSRVKNASPEDLYSLIRMANEFRGLATV